jgi:hypothetical protein
MNENLKKIQQPSELTQEKINELAINIQSARDLIIK